MNATLTVLDGAEDTLAVTMAGDWLLEADLPGVDPVLDRLRQAAPPGRVRFDATGLGEWDTGLVVNLVAIRQCAEANDISIDDSELPDGARQLLSLAFAVKEREGARRQLRRSGLLESVGESTILMFRHGKELLTFVGELVLSLVRWFSGHATYLRSDLAHYAQEAGRLAAAAVEYIVSHQGDQHGTYGSDTGGVNNARN